MRAVSLISISFLMILSFGCGSCRKDKEECISYIRIISPDNKMVISGFQDEEPNRVGLQFSIEAEVASCMPEGSPASLLVNDDPNRVRESFSNEGRVVFEAVTLVPLDEDGHVVLTAAVRDGNTGRMSRDSVLVRLEDLSQVDCIFISPAEGAVLGPDDDVLPETPGIQHNVVIRCIEDITGTPAGLTVDGTPVPSAIFYGTDVSFPAVHLSEGLNILRGSFAIESGLWSGQIQVWVDTPDCEVRLHPSGAYVFNLDGDEPRIPGREAVADLDGDPENGIQALFRMPVADCGGGIASLYIDGEKLVSSPVGNNEYVEFEEITLPDGEDVRVHIEVEPVMGDSPAGRSITHSFWVDSIRPDPTLLFPSSGDVLLSDSDLDGDLSNGLQIELYIDAPDLESFPDPSVPWRAALIEAHLTRIDPETEEDTTKTYSCLVGIDGCMEDVNPDRFRIPIDLDLVAEYEVIVVITDPAGNIGTEGPVLFETDARAVELSIDSPEADSIINLEYPGVSGQEIPVTVTSDSPEIADADIRLSCTGAPVVIGAMVDGRADFFVDFSNLPCTGEEITCIARVVFEEIQYSSEPLLFTVDLVPPGTEIIFPFEGDTIHRSDISVEVRTTCLEDSRPVNIYDHTGAVLGTAENFSGRAVVPVTLGAGEHTIFPGAADAAGNYAAGDTVTFNVAGDPPYVVFIDPLANAVLGPSDDADPALPGFQYNVQVQVSNEPEGTPVTLEIGYDDNGIPVWGSSIATVDTSLPDKIAVFNNVTLPEGIVGLRAVAAGEQGQRGEAVIWFRVETGADVCNILSPVDGSTIGPAHDSQASPSAGVRHDVRVQTDLADGVEVYLALTDADGNTTNKSAYAVGGNAVFHDVVFTTEAGSYYGTNLLEAQCGPHGSSALPATINVALESPVAEILMPSDGEIFNASSEDAGPDPGFRVNFRAEAINPSTGSSIAAGSTGLLIVDCGIPPASEYSLNFVAYGSVIQARATPELPDQASCVFTFTARDSAGNESEPVSVSITVDRIPPLISVDSPIDGVVFDSDDDSRPEQEGFQYSVELSYSGLEDGSLVHLYLSRESEGGIETEIPSSPHIVSSATQDGFVFEDVTLTTLSADEVTIIARTEDNAGNEAFDFVVVNILLLDPQLAITTPLPGAPCFNLMNDLNMDEPDIYIRVEVETEDIEEGMAINLCGTGRSAEDSEECGLEGYSLIETMPASETGITAFLEIMLIDGMQNLVTAVEGPDGENITSAPLEVCADSSPPRVLSFDVPADLNDDGYINEDEMAAAGGVICFEFEVEGADGETLTLYTENPMPGVEIGQGEIIDGEVEICGIPGEGSHLLVALVFDENGNPNIWPDDPQIENPEAMKLLFISTIAPTISITSPSTSVTAPAGTDPTVTFRVSSNAEGGTVTFYVNDVEEGQDTVDEGIASVEVVLTNNQTHALRAEVEDIAGNTSSATRSVTVAPPVEPPPPPPPPTLEITSPPALVNAAVAGENVDPVILPFSVTSDANGRQVRFFVDDDPVGQVTVSGGTASIPDLIFDNNSDYVLRAEVTDANAQTTVRTRNVKVDTTPPEVVFITPDDDAKLNNQEITISVVVDGAEPGSDFEVYITSETPELLIFEDTVPADPAAQPHTFSFDYDFGVDGVLEMEARAIDDAENTGTDNVTIEINTVGCSLVWHDPSESPFVFEPPPGHDLFVLSEVVVAETLVDCEGLNISLFRNGEHEVDETVDADGRASFNVTLSPEDEGTFTAEIEDEFGNITTASFDFEVDWDMPEVNITRPAVGASCVNLLTDFNKGDPDYVYTQVDVETSGIAEGLDLVLCGTERGALDPTPDECNEPGYYVIETRTVTLGTMIFSQVKFMHGNQNFLVEIEDSEGTLLYSEPLSGCADSEPPEVERFDVLSDLNIDGYINADEYVLAGGEICFRLGVEDADGRTLTVRTDNPEPDTMVGQGVVDTGIVEVCGHLEEGVHNLEAHVRDANNNPNLWPADPLIENDEALLELIVDITPPTLSIVEPPAVVNADYAGGENIDPTVEFKVTSNAEGQEVFFRDNTVDPGVLIDSEIVFEGTASINIDLDNGETYILQAMVSDFAGNITEKDIEVRVDTTPPGIQILEPVEGEELDNNVILMEVLVTGAEEGEPLHVYSHPVLPGDEALYTGTISAVQPQDFSFSLPRGEHTLVARAWDAAENMGESVPVTFDVEPVGCSLVWVAPSTSPRVFNIYDDEEPGTPGLQRTLVVETEDDCSVYNIILYKNESMVDEFWNPIPGSPPQAAFEVTLDNGESGTFKATIEDMHHNITEASFDFHVDITAPELIRTSPASDSLAYVTAANPTVGDTIGGFLRVADKNPGAPAYADFSFEAVGAPTVTPTGTKSGSFRLLLDGVTVYGPVSITNDPETVNIVDLQFPQGTAGVLEARLVDGAGNITNIMHDIVVDVVAPAAPSITSMEITDNRRATVDIEWAQVYDDGSDPATGYPHEIEVRWATSAITGETSYGNAKLAAVLAGNVLTETLSPLPPLNKYWIAVRARDAMDNISPLISGTNVQCLENMWNEVVLEGDDGGLFGYTMVPRGVDLNNDDFDDLIVGAPYEAVGGTQRGAVYIYYGGNDPANLTRQKLLGEQDYEFFGLGLSSGDLTGNGTSDILIGADGFQSNRGRAFIYFGDSAGGQIDETERVEFRGNSGVSGRLGWPVSILGDINQNGIKDMALTARTEGGVGYVYIFFGRTKAQWQAMADALGYVPVSDADLIIAGVEAEGNFGFWKGNVGIGPLGPGDGDAFVIPAHPASRAYVFRAADVLAAAGSTILASDAFQILEGDARYGIDGFMTLLDGSQRHLVMSDENASPNRVYVYSVDDSGVDDATPVQVLQYSGARFGFSLAFGDITGNNLPDMLVGTNNATVSSFFLFCNNETSSPFPSTASSTVRRDGHLGVSLWVGDINNDGIRDVASGAASSGKVFLWW